MSGPMAPDQWPTDVREFRNRLDAYNLAAGVWLGLDPKQTFNFNLAEGEPPQYVSKVGTLTEITWESLTEQKPKVEGDYTRGVRGDFELTVWTARFVLHWPTSEAMRREIGPRPRMFSRTEEARLRNLFA